MSKTFYYFAYGSNMLAKRMRISSPDAVRKGCGKLKEYRLDFNSYSNFWNGAVATIVPTENETVWGVIWEIDVKNLPKLDRQEGVSSNFYFVLEKNIETIDGQNIGCRLYQMVDTPPTLKKNDVLPVNRRPSLLYLNVMIKGAMECNLPESYQNFLRNILTNGHEGSSKLKTMFNIS